MASLAPFTGTLDKKKAAHLLRRTTFGPSRQQVDRFTGMNVDQALTEIYQAVPVPVPPANFPLFGDDVDQGDQIEIFRAWALELMRVGGTKGTSGIEKLVFFLHTVFTMRISVVENHAALYYNNVLLRYYALGNIKELAAKVSVDNAMLILLDGRINKKGNPNENYARELLELYTIGKGPQIGPGDYTTYTEDDIKAAAKVLSGWEFDDKFSILDPVTGIPQGRFRFANHDDSVKTFSKAFGNKTISTVPATGTTNQSQAEAGMAELNLLLDMIFAQLDTAKNISRKIYRFFMYYKITKEIEDDIITPMAQSLVANNYELKPVLFQFLKSQHFFDEDTTTIIEDNNRSAIIKSPLEIVLGTLRFFDIPVPNPYATSFQGCLFEQGLDLFEPLDVAGYDAYHQEPDYNRNWISSNNLARRYQFGDLIIRGKNSGSGDLGAKLDIIAYVKDPKNISDPTSDVVVVDELLNYLLPESITEERRAYFFNVFTEGLPSSNWAMEWNKYKNTGDDMGVRNQLEKLLNKILQSPEYQLG